MQAIYSIKRSGSIFSVAVLSLLSRSGSAQVANPAPSPEPSATAVAPIATNADDQASAPTVMSPFEVDSTQDTGYRARNTLAGSRISTNLEDLATPITVVTKDFMDDIGAVDVNDVLTYEAGTEGTKDFTSNTPTGTRTNDNVAADPNAATRGWGLAPFDITRDYFYSLTVQSQFGGTGGSGTSVGFDSYNLDNITISRGADSILAGLGSPAGVINYAPQLANLDRNTNLASYRFGSYGDKRAVINSNIVAKEGVLAFRVAGVWNNKGFEQQPSFDVDKRYYLAGTWKPFSKTTIRGSLEVVNVHANFPNSLTPEDDITQWIQLGKPAAPPPGSTNLSIPNSTASFITAPNGGPASEFFAPNGTLIGTYDETGYFYQQQNLSNVGIWQPIRMSSNLYGDWEDLNTNGSHQDNKLTTDSFSIDQEIFPNFNVNVAFLHEIFDSSQLSLGNTNNVVDAVDVNPTLPWGAVNPNFGDTFMSFSQVDDMQKVSETNRVARATATYDLDLTKFNKWFGRFVFTGFVEDRRTTFDDSDYTTIQGGLGANSLNGQAPNVFTYTGGNASNGYFTSTAPIAPFTLIDAPFTNSTGVTSDTFDTQALLKLEQKNITKLQTSAFVLQAYLLDNLAVGTFGIRRDKEEGGNLATSGADPTSNVVNPLPADQYGPLSIVQAQTKTYGVVLHGPKIGNIDLKWLSVGYSQSQNFIPNAGSTDLLGNPTPDPVGTTKDYSIAVDTLGGKLNAKIDWFTSVAANSADSTINFPFVQWTLPFLLLQNDGVGTVGAYADLAQKAGITNYQSGIAPGITTGDAALANAYTANSQSKGMEFELTYNVTKNWRVFGTVTREQAEESNIAPSLTTFINQRIAYWQANGIWNGPVTTKEDWCGCPETGQQVFNDQVVGPFIAYQAANGQPSQQLHKWKATLVTNYTVSKGPAKGLGFGTGLRYFDKTIIGDPAIYTLVNGTETVTGLDLAHPYTVPGTTNVEAWVTYSRRIYKNKYILTFRFEADNLQTSGGYLPINANSDGTHQLFTVEPPRTYYFTSELKF
jgi:outer membrane receptor protein involved in Fe transport